MWGTRYASDASRGHPAGLNETPRPSSPVIDGGFYSIGGISCRTRACTKGGRCLFFEVQAEGRLARVEEEAGLVRECVFQRIRVVAMVGRRWLIDLDPKQFTGKWRIWAVGDRPLVRLQWDLGKWFWLGSRSGPLQFYQYIMRFGQRLLLS